MRKSLALFSFGVLVAMPLFACASQAELLDSPIVEELNRGQESGDATFDHSRYDALVRQHVDTDEGVVDYAGLSEDRSQLTGYLETIAAAELTGLGGDEQLALLINAYNACTLDLILEHYPDIDSIRDLSSPWETPRCEVGGYTLSLDQIEHNLIRPMFKDPRIHFAVNCAAVDCPPLAEFAYTGDAVDDQLAQRTEATLSDRQFARVESEQLRYTKVMHWYRSDFVSDEFSGSADSVAAYIARHTERESVRQFVEQHDGDPPASPLEYDWSLNDAN